MEPVAGRADPVMLVSLHDVSPRSWPLYQPLLQQLDALERLRLTLLVVPDFHRRDSVADNAGFCRAMDRRLARGDELVLHGFHHCDEGPRPKTPRAIIQRRILTHEGEFAALGLQEARRRLNAGRALFARQDWPLDGFVPPGWVASDAARTAMVDTGFHYTADGHRLYRLPDWRPLRVPTLVWSARSAWRRLLFERINRTRLWRFRHSPVIRLAIHPVDVCHGRSLDFWRDSIRDLYPTHRSLTKRQWVALASGEAV